MARILAPVFAKHLDLAAALSASRAFYLHILAFAVAMTKLLAKVQSKGVSYWNNAFSNIERFTYPHFSFFPHGLPQCGS